MSKSFNGQAVDVSHWNENIDWKKVENDGISTATEGSNYQDNFFVKNWNEMKENRIEAIAYHYFRVSHSIEDQINKCCCRSTFMFLKRYFCDRCRVKKQRGN